MSKIEILNQQMTKCEVEKLISTMIKPVNNCTCGRVPNIKLIETFELDCITFLIEITCDKCKNEISHLWISDDRGSVKRHMMIAVTEWNDWVKQSKESK